MSGIFGIFNRNGRPVDTRAMADMARAMDYWGPDGSTQWVKGQMGLGHLMLHTTPESLYEKQPLVSPCRNYILVSHARIDNRKDLFDRLNIHSALQKNMPDNELIMKSWEKWGKDCPKYLMGDWVFALFDRKNQELFLAKDHFGISGLYYYQTEKLFVFASSLKGLFALPVVPKKLNALNLAQFLTGTPQIPGETPYKDIFRISPAHCIRISQKSMTQERYWILENTPATWFARDEEYVEAFMELYTRAVRARLRSIKPVGAQLSGGLDSGSMAAIAAGELKKNNKHLTTFSAVPLYDVSHITAFPNRFLDETPYIKATADFCGNITTHFVKSDQISPFQGIQNWFDITLLPVHGAGNLYWILTLLEKAKGENLGVLLGGQRGNATISWAGRKEKMSPMHRLIHLLGTKKYPLPVLVQKAKTHILGKIKNRFNKKNPWDEFARINPEFLKGMDFCPISPSPSLEQMHLIRPREGMRGAIQYELGAWFGLELRDPTADKRVAEYCFSLPNDQYQRDGTNRLLIRRAMAGILPDRVRLNTRKGLQSGDLGKRLSEDPNLLPLLETLHKFLLFNRVFDGKSIGELQEKTNRTHFENLILTKTSITGIYLLSLDR